MRSDTSEGVAQVFLEFDLERNVDIAAQDVRDKLSAVQSELPIDAKAPVVDKFDPDAAPILGIVLSGPSSIRDLTLLADDTIKPQIESINGVGGVRVMGGREREIRVWLRLDDLKARSLSAQDVIDALRKENVEFPGGRIEAGSRELVVKTRGRVPQVADFKDLIVVTVADVVKAKLDQIRTVLPEDHKLLVIQDLSTLMIAVSLSPMLCARLLVLPKTEDVAELARSFGGSAVNPGGSPKALAASATRWRCMARRLNPGRAIEVFLNWTERFYGRLLHIALGNRVLVLASAVGLFIASGFLLPLIGQEFTPSEDEGQFSVQVEAPVGSSIHQTDRIAAAVEQRMERLPFIKDIYTTIGGQYEGMVTVADVMVKLAEKVDRTLSQAELMAMAREQLSDLSHLRLSVNAINRTGGGGGMRTAPIQYNLRGDSMEELTAFADTIVGRLRATPGFVDVNTTSQTGKPEVSVTIDRDRASDLGVKVEDVGKAVSALIGGQKVTTFEDDGKSIDVRLRLVGSDREQARAIQALPLRRLDGQLTELRNLAAVDMTLGPVTIERQSRRRQVTVLANLEATKPLGEGVDDVRKLESELRLPDGVVSIFTGSADMMAESFASILFCLFMAVVPTYMILAAQFESFLHPFTIMLSLPLSVGGALGGLFLLGRTLNIFSMIGMVMLMGPVTKNAILLVDYTNLLRSRGVGKTEALLQAGPVRLRPILMTALSTIAGMIPVALGLGDGAASRAPMGACVVGGMITSTFLTLIVIPVAYSVVESGYDGVIRLFLSGGRQNATAPVDLSANVAPIVPSEVAALTLAPSDRNVTMETISRRVQRIS